MVISYVSAGLYVLLGVGAFMLSNNGLLGLPVAIILSVAETVGLFFLESALQKKRLANPDLKLWWCKEGLTTKQCIAEFVQIGISTLLINISLSVFNNDTYAVHHYGEYDIESGFFYCFETVPGVVEALLVLIIPMLLYILTVSGRKFLSLFSGLFVLLGVIANNTVCQFGEYYIVAAAGNESLRYNDVSEYANTVTTMLFVFAIGLMIVSIVDIIINVKKNKILIIVSAVTALIGAALICVAFVAENKSTTFDIMQLKAEIYGDAKKFSEKFQSENFNNKYGTMSTKCAHPDCEMNIVTSGDSNCCIIHSNKCGNCGCYIDEDAMYCMTCVANSLNNNKNSSYGHECYICGDKAYSKYGSYYYCPDCKELVKAFSE